MKHGITISDLHLFSKRSKSKPLEDRLSFLLNSQDILVLNGDIFDFRWSVYPSHSETIKQAIDWIQSRLKKYPHLKIAYVLGNHDYNQPFIHALKTLQDENTRFSFYEFYLQIEDALFLHGDCVNQFQTFESHKKYRNHWAKEQQWSSFLGLGYQILDLFNIPKLMHKQKFPNHKIGQKITHYLKTIPGGIPEGIKHIYLGHTHIPIESFQWESFYIHNSGSAITKFDWKILTFTIEGESPLTGV